MAFVRTWWVAIGLVLTSVAVAQTPAPPPEPAPSVAPTPGTVPPQAPATRPATGNVVGRTPLPRAAPRTPRTFAECNREALNRRYRGAERRHYVARCQLGVRRLFRRRGTAAQPAAAPAPAPARTP